MAGKSVKTKVCKKTLEPKVQNNAILRLIINSGTNLSICKLNFLSHILIRSEFNHNLSRLTFLIYDHDTFTADDKMYSTSDLFIFF